MIDPTTLLLSLAALPSPAGLELHPWLDFRDAPQAATGAAAWRPVHDGVMGGVSSGKATAGEEGVRFAGRVSLENNGGFASFRIGAGERPELAAFDGLRLTVRGDGQVYKLGLRTDGRWDGVSWQVPFATVAGEWTAVDLRFADLAPTFHGRLVADAPPFDPAGVRELGILIADKQAGPFALELASIEAWRAKSSAASVERTRAAAGARTAALAAALDGGADAGEIVAALRRNERLVVVASPSAFDLDAPSSLQIGRMTAHARELAARELRVVYLMGDRAGRLAGRTLGPEQVVGLRRTWKLPADEWAVALVGKDGGVKSRWSELVEPDRVFEEIDAMPMRRREVEERAGG